MTTSPSKTAFRPDFRHDLGDDVLLRTLKRDDAEELFALTDRNRARLREWLPWLDRNAEIEHSTAFIDYMTVLAEKKDALTVGIFLNGVLAGLTSFNKVDWANRSVSIGYWIGDGFVGRGLITRATQALCRYAFQELGMRRAEIRCATGNTKSQRIPVHLGFEFEGIARDAEWLYDHFVSHKVYSLLSSEADRLEEG